MTRYILNQLLRNKVLLAWPGAILLFFLLFMVYASTGYAGEAGYIFEFGEAALPAGFLMTALTGVILLIVLIALPTHLITNTEPGRASLLLTKPISRTDYFLSDLSAVAIITFGYSIFSIALFALFFLIKGTVFPVSILLGLAALPFTVMAYYINILLLGLLFKNYLLTVFFCYILAGVSNLLFSIREVLTGSGIEPGTMITILEMAQYVIPGVGPSSAVSEGLFNSGAHGLDLSILSFGLIAHYFVSLIPFTAWAYYIIRNRNF